MSVENEIKKWEDKVLYDVKFKEDTGANLERLNIIRRESIEHFCIIAANSEALVYKIGRYFIENNILCEDMTVADGLIIESYIGGDTAEWKKRELIDDYMSMFAKDFNQKWVLIPHMEFEISVGLCIYFVNQFRKYNATGIIMYGQGPGNVVEVFAQNASDIHFYEFPKILYRAKKRVLPKDEY